MRYSDLMYLLPASAVAQHLGIFMPVVVSSGLYREHIMNHIGNPIKNAETLCHAFLFAVDCELRDSAFLEFSVPGNGAPSYKVRAHLRFTREQSLLFERVVP